MKAKIVYNYVIRVLMTVQESSNFNIEQINSQVHNKHVDQQVSHNNTIAFNIPIIYAAPQF